MKNEKIDENIRHRAFLNSVTAWIDTVVKLVVRFIIDPIIISSLGGTLYGVWQILNQLNNYLATADLRVATALKWIIAKDRTIKTERELIKSVSTAFFTNMLFLPLYLVAGAVIIYVSPFVTRVEGTQFQLVRQTSAIMVLSFILTQFFFLFESFLAGMNLAYKRVGIRAVITVISGIFTYVFLKAGLSINGLAIVNVFTSIATGLTFVWIVKKTFPWFCFIKIKLKQVFNFVSLSVWFLIDKIVMLFNESIDLILLGHFAGPQFAASYTVSRFVIQAIANLFRSGQSAITPGITRFLSEKKFHKIVYFRKSMIIMNWFVLGIAGTVVILLNKSFVGLWTEKNLFAGFIETFLVVLFMLLKTLHTIDSSIIIMNLNLKIKILYSTISAFLTIIAAIFLIPRIQIVGLLISLIIGLLFRIIVFAFLSEKILCGKGFIKDLFFSRLSFFSILILSSSIYIAPQIFTSSWVTFICYGVISFFLTTIIFWYLALNKTNRKFIIENIRKTRLFDKYREKNHD